MFDGELPASAQCLFPLLWGSRTGQMPLTSGLRLLGMIAAVSLRLPL